MFSRLIGKSPTGGGAESTPSSAPPSVTPTAPPIGPEAAPRSSDISHAAPFPAVSHASSTSTSTPSSSSSSFSHPSQTHPTSPQSSSLSSQSADVISNIIPAVSATITSDTSSTSSSSSNSALSVSAGPFSMLQLGVPSVAALQHYSHVLPENARRLAANSLIALRRMLHSAGQHSAHLYEVMLPSLHAGWLFATTPLLTPSSPIFLQLPEQITAFLSAYPSTTSPVFITATTALLASAAVALHLVRKDRLSRRRPRPQVHLWEPTHTNADRQSNSTGAGTSTSHGAIPSSLASFGSADAAVLSVTDQMRGEDVEEVGEEGDWLVALARGSKVRAVDVDADGDIIVRDFRPLSLSRVLLQADRRAARQSRQASASSSTTSTTSPSQDLRQQLQQHATAAAAAAAAGSTIVPSPAGQQMHPQQLGVHSSEFSWSHPSSSHSHSSSSSHPHHHHQHHHSHQHHHNHQQPSSLASSLTAPTTPSFSSTPSSSLVPRPSHTNASSSSSSASSSSSNHLGYADGSSTRRYFPTPLHPIPDADLDESMALSQASLSTLLPSSSSASSSSLPTLSSDVSSAVQYSNVGHQQSAIDLGNQTATAPSASASHLVMPSPALSSSSSSSNSSLVPVIVPSLLDHNSPALSAMTINPLAPSASSAAATLNPGLGSGSNTQASSEASVSTLSTPSSIGLSASPLPPVVQRSPMRLANDPLQRSSSSNSNTANGNGGGDGIGNQQSSSMSQSPSRLQPKYLLGAQKVMIIPPSSSSASTSRTEETKGAAQQVEGQISQQQLVEQNRTEEERKDQGPSMLARARTAVTAVTSRLSNLQHALLHEDALSSAGVVTISAGGSFAALTNTTPFVVCVTVVVLFIVLYAMFSRIPMFTSSHSRFLATTPQRVPPSPFVLQQLQQQQSNTTTTTGSSSSSGIGPRRLGDEGAATNNNTTNTRNNGSNNISSDSNVCPSVNAPPYPNSASRESSHSQPTDAEHSEQESLSSTSSSLSYMMPFSVPAAPSAHNTPLLVHRKARTKDAPPSSSFMSSSTSASSSSSSLPSSDLSSTPRFPRISSSSSSEHHQVELMTPFVRSSTTTSMSTLDAYLPMPMLPPLPQAQLRSHDEHSFAPPMTVEDSLAGSHGSNRSHGSNGSHGSNKSHGSSQYDTPSVAADVPPYSSSSLSSATTVTTSSTNTTASSSSSSSSQSTPSSSPIVGDADASVLATLTLTAPLQPMLYHATADTNVSFRDLCRAVVLGRGTTLDLFAPDILPGSSSDQGTISLYSLDGARSRPIGDGARGGDVEVKMPLSSSSSSSSSLSLSPATPIRDSLGRDWLVRRYYVDVLASLAVRRVFKGASPAPSIGVVSSSSSSSSTTSSPSFDPPTVSLCVEELICIDLGSRTVTVQVTNVEHQSLLHLHHHMTFRENAVDPNANVELTLSSTFAFLPAFGLLQRSVSGPAMASVATQAQEVLTQLPLRVRALLSLADSMRPATAAAGTTATTMVSTAAATSAATESSSSSRPQQGFSLGWWSR